MPAFYQRVHWDEAEMMSWHERGGMVYDFARANGIAAAAHAKAIAPIRSGKMMLGIRSDTQRSGPMSVRSYIRSEVFYSVFVLKGTNRIYPKNGQWLVLPGFTADAKTRGRAEGKVYTSFRTKSVSGQTANNFLLRAAEAQNRLITRGFGAHGYASLRSTRF